MTILLPDGRRVTWDKPAGLWLGDLFRVGGVVYRVERFSSEWKRGGLVDYAVASVAPRIHTLDLQEPPVVPAQGRLSL